MSPLLSLISKIVNDPELAAAAKVEQIKAALEAVAVPVTGIIERLAAALKVEAGFFHTNPHLTSDRCSTVVEPLLDGERLETQLVGPRTQVLAKLKSNGRRSATVAEGLLYGLTHPEELENGWIWCLDQVVEVGGREYVLVLHMRGSERLARLYDVAWRIDAYDRVLSFPMTPEELAARDAEAG